MDAVPRHHLLRLRPARISLGALLIFGCACWQNRADDLQHSLNVFVERGGRHKNDFVRRFGAPASCEPINIGEICRWSVKAGQMRVGFDKDGNYTGGSGVVKRGRHTYRGEDEEAVRDAAADSCSGGKVIQDEQCVATPATERTEAHSAQEDTSGE